MSLVTPLLQFRMWLRRGPSSERIAAGLASVLLVALMAWGVGSLGGTGASVTTGLSADSRTGRPQVSTEAADGGTGATGGSVPLTSGQTPGGSGDAAARRPTEGASAGAVVQGRPCA